MAKTLNSDYLVVGGGAAGMAFVDALTDHSDATVVMVDRRHSVGGHWLEAYPFVRLHQASAFYGVASTLLGGGRVQQEGPEVGLHERATAPEIVAYYERILGEHLAGQVSFFPNSEYVGAGRFVSRLSGQAYDVRGARIVNAHYLSPTIPASTPPPFGVAEGARVIPVNDLPKLSTTPSQFVIVGSGKTATDACIFLLDNGVDPDAITWVRPRDPWMLNRAVIQPNAPVFVGAAADIMTAAAGAVDPDSMFLQLEEDGVMLRIDRTVTPTMAKTPTLGLWELDLLRTIERVVRLGHLKHVSEGQLVLAEGSVALARDAVVVHCAASALPQRPLVPIWGSEEITIQPIRTGFPCFGAALAGYVEATIEGDAEKNRLCPPSPYSNTTTDWSAMQVLGYRAASSFSANPDLKAWANGTAINPSRVPPGMENDPLFVAASLRLRENVDAGIARMAEFAGLS